MKTPDPNFIFNRCGDCSECGCDRGCSKNECGCNHCKPARYSDCLFDIQVNPYNDQEWIATLNGMSHKVKVPKLAETDTKLSINNSNAFLNYAAEAHTDKITGEQLGGIVELGNLRDVDFDPDFTGICSELIYRKYQDCGEGCTSPADQWRGFNVNSEGAKQNGIKYVRGANVYGCPTYLDVPTNENQYWFGMWRPSDTGQGITFGYHQPTEVETLPKNGLGQTIVMSIDPTTKKPVYGTLPLDCIMNNIVGNLGIDIYSTWSVVQETPQFSASFNNITGDFSINWNDWNGANHVGTGRVTGKMNFVSHFDTSTGAMQYTVSSLYFGTCTWTRDNTYVGPSFPNSITLKGLKLGTAEETMLIDHHGFDGNSWTVNMDTTINCNYTTNVLPGATVGPLNFTYIYVDWVGDDEGYLQINFHNKLSGWQTC